VPSDPILRASNEAGDTYDDPSEDLLFELLAELGEGNSFLVVDWLEPGRTEDSIQAVIDANGSFVLEISGGQMAGSNVMRCVLREVRDEDLPLLFEQWTDPIAGRMAAFTTPDQADWDAFERRWSRLRADESVINRAIVVDGEVTGTIGSWGDPGEREVTYWIGRSHWGKGIATGALSAFLAVDLSRPLHARVAYDNVASRRVLEKCGFRFIATDRGFAQARSAEIEEQVLRLES